MSDHVWPWVTLSDCEWLWVTMVMHGTKLRPISMQHQGSIRISTPSYYQWPCIIMVTHSHSESLRVSQGHWWSLISNYGPMTQMTDRWPKMTNLWPRWPASVQRWQTDDPDDRPVTKMSGRWPKMTNRWPRWQMTGQWPKMTNWWPRWPKVSCLSWKVCRKTWRPFLRSVKNAWFHITKLRPMSMHNQGSIRISVLSYHQCPCYTMVSHSHSRSLTVNYGHLRSLTVTHGV